MIGTENIKMEWT